MLLLLTVQVIAAVAAPVLVRAMGRKAFWVLALAPASAAVWALTWTSAVQQGNGPTESVQWVPSLGIELSFRLDTLSWFMTLIVGGVGALVLVYCAAYFKTSASGLGRFAAVFVAFAGAMLGLVIADDMLLLFVFWELTTVTSYLLIGHYAERKASRRAAMQAHRRDDRGRPGDARRHHPAGRAAGTYRLSEIIARPAARDRRGRPSRSSACWPGRSPSPRSSRSTSGCPRPWRPRRRSARTCTRRRW